VNCIGEVEKDGAIDQSRQGGGVKAQLWPRGKGVCGLGFIP
jgi:hypothetical protein